MATVDNGTQDTMAHATPSLTYSATLHWNGMGDLYRAIHMPQISTDSQHSCWPLPGQPATAHRVPLPIMSSPLRLVPAPSPPAIDCDKEASCLTFYLESDLLLATVHDRLIGVTGVLLWVHRGAYVEGLSPSVHPMLRVRAAYEAPQAEHVELVLRLHAHDPLRHHIILVLQAASATADIAGRLYAETLANALGPQVGCTDQSYFTALFRKHVGTTPKAYRDAVHRV